jgi:flagellar basal-body rod protein FlgC
MFTALDTSTSALVANRVRMDVIADNIANSESILDSNGAYSPYTRRFAVFAQGDPTTNSAQGVHVQGIGLDDAPLQMRFEPDSPWANKDGYVGYPNVSIVIEQMNAMEASRSYEANISAIEATKSMLMISLQMLA